MRKLITYIFALIVLISLVHITKDIIEFSREIIILDDHELSAKIKEKRMLRSTVKITSIALSYQDSSGQQNFMKLSSATGFSLKYDVGKDESLVITNDHFCKVSRLNNGGFLIEDYRLNIFEGEEVLSDPLSDLCILRVSGHIKPVEIVEYDYEISPFQKIYVVGAPSGTFPIIFDSYFSRYMDRREVNIGLLKQKGNPYLLISEQVFPGHSGSPVFLSDGRVVGIIFGSLRTYGGLAASAKDIYKILDEIN